MTTWFTASLFFQGVHHGSAEAESLWQEIIVLLEASDVDAANSMAARIGTQRQHSYYVDTPIRHLLEWKFVRVERVCEVESDVLANGAEVFSRFLRASEATSLLQPLD